MINTIRKKRFIWLLLLLECRYLSGMWFRTDGYQKDMCFKEIGLCVQDYENHSKLDGRHNQRDLYDRSMSTRIFTLIINRIFIGASKIEGKVTVTSIWIY